MRFFEIFLLPYFTFTPQEIFTDRTIDLCVLKSLKAVQKWRHYFRLFLPFFSHGSKKRANLNLMMKSFKALFDHKMFWCFFSFRKSYLFLKVRLEGLNSFSPLKILIRIVLLEFFKATLGPFGVSTFLCLKMSISHEKLSRVVTSILKGFG